MAALTTHTPGPSAFIYGPASTSRSKMETYNSYYSYVPAAHAISATQHQSHNAGAYVYGSYGEASDNDAKNRGMPEKGMTESSPSSDVVSVIRFRTGRGAVNVPEIERGEVAPPVATQVQRDLSDESSSGVASRASSPPDNREEAAVPSSWTALRITALASVCCCKADRGANSTSSDDEEEAAPSSWTALRIAALANVSPCTATRDASSISGDAEEEAAPSSWTALRIAALSNVRPCTNTRGTGLPHQDTEIREAPTTTTYEQDLYNSDEGAIPTDSGASTTSEGSDWSTAPSVVAHIRFTNAVTVTIMLAASFYRAVVAASARLNREDSMHHEAWIRHAEVDHAAALAALEVLDEERESIAGIVQDDEEVVPQGVSDDAASFTTAPESLE